MSATHSPMLGDHLDSRETTKRATAISYPRLRPGPGQQADRVASHQRLRLHQAMLQLVADEGYETITVRKLARLAGVSTASFYARFDGKEECFLTSCGLILDRIHGQVRAARSHRRSPCTQLTRTAEAFLAEPTANPDSARVALIDAFGGGPAALRRIREFEAHVEADIKSSLSRRGGTPSATVTAWVTAGWLRACRNLLDRSVLERDHLAAQIASWAASHLEDLHFLTGRTGLSDSCPDDTQPPLPPPRFDERGAILAATTKLAIADGFWRMRASDIRKRAGVSRAVFAANFDGVDDCYLGAAADLARDYLSPLLAPRAGAAGSFQSVHQAMTRLARRVAAEPEKARLAFVGILDPGLPGVRVREQMIGEFSVHWHGGTTSGPQGNLLSAEATVSALWQLIAHRIEANATAKLSAEASTLTLLLLAPAYRMSKGGGTSDEFVGAGQVRAISA